MGCEVERDLPRKRFDNARRKLDDGDAGRNAASDELAVPTACDGDPFALDAVEPPVSEDVSIATKLGDRARAGMAASLEGKCEALESLIGYGRLDIGGDDGGGDVSGERCPLAPPGEVTCTVTSEWRRTLASARPKTGDAGLLGAVAAVVTVDEAAVTLLS
jgi:hypothetical protein